MNARCDAGSLPMRHAARWATVLLILCAIGVPARAQNQNQNQDQSQVDLQLALMVDTSGSVSQPRFELQRRGYVDALRNPRILQMILSGPRQSVAVTMVQWTGPSLHAVVLPWTVLNDKDSILSAAQRVEDTPRQLFGGGTSISGAIDTAMSLFAQSPFKSRRHVIDISGDGANNSGRSITRARDDAVKAGATINGLPILAFEPDLDRYYHDFVIGGPNAFIVVAKNFESFADAILKKMTVEIAANETAASGIVRKRN